MNWIVIIIVILAAVILMKFILKATRFIFKLLLFLAIVGILFYGINRYGTEISFKIPEKQGLECQDTIECINSTCVADSFYTDTGRCEKINSSSCIVILNKTKTLFCPKLEKS